MSRGKLIFNIAQLPTGSYEISGSFFGTASWAESASYALLATSASFASTASQSLLSINTASVNNATITFTKGNATTFPITINNVVNATSASFATNSITATSASYAITASHALNGGGGATIDTSSFVTTSSFNTFTSSIQTQVNSLTAATSSYILASQTSSMLNPYVLTSSTASMTVLSSSFAISASKSSTSSFAISSSYSVTSSYASNTISSSYAVTSSYVLQAVSSSYTTFAQTASYITTAQTASFITASNIFGPYGSNSVISASYSNTSTSASYASNGGVTQLLAGSNITLSPTNGIGQVTITSTGGGPNFNTATGSYGSFYDTTTQTNPVASIPRSMSFNTTDISNGVSISGSTSPYNTYIKTANAGVYNIQFSAQFDRTNSGTDTVYIWLRKNGIDIVETNTSIVLTGTAAANPLVAAWNWFTNSAAGDYYQIMWASGDTHVRLLADNAPTYGPTLPSIILTVNRVDQFLSNTGSFTGSFTGTLTGTASYASQALSASYAETASYVPDYLPLTGGTISGALHQSGTFYPDQINWFSSSIGYNTGSYILTTTANGLTTYANYQDVASTLTPYISTVSSSISASYASQALSSSFASTASYIQTAQTASYVLQAVSASYATTALSSSYAATSSFINPLNQQVVVTGSLRGQVSALTITGGAASVNLSTNNFFTLGLVNGANTVITPTNVNPGQTVNILITQGTLGTGTVSFPGLVKQPSGSLYTGSAVANAVDIVTMVAFDSNTVYVSSVRNMI